MDSDKAMTTLVSAVARYKHAKQRSEEARVERDERIVVALDSQIPQVLVCEVTGLTREQVRRIAKEARSEADPQVATEREDGDHN